MRLGLRWLTETKKGRQIHQGLYFAGLNSPLTSTLFLAPVAEWLVTKNVNMRANLEKVEKETREYDQKRAWYMSRFLLGKIDESSFRSQPCVLYLTGRLHLAKALQAEMKSDFKEAWNNYRSYRHLPLAEKGIDPAIDAFIDWRIQTIDKLSM